MRFHIGRYDEFGRLKKQFRGMSEADKKVREEAALARLRGEYNPAPSAAVSLMSVFGLFSDTAGMTLLLSC